VNSWTDELLNLMIEKLVERKERETKMIERVREQGSSKTSNPDDIVQKFGQFHAMGSKVKVVKSD